jgi:NAD(P)-dependent dehydrogenase (short-subunit alcohol dehydrogenase family)
MKDKLLVITGASRGIGRETAGLFCRNGYSVVNLSRSPCDLPSAINFNWDLSQAEWPADLLQEIREIAEQSESVCLIHNAAMLEKDDLSSLDAEVLRQVLEVNVVAPQRLNQMLRPHMKAGSSILYVGSTLAEKAVPNAYSYVLSKHAGAGMMKANCQDLAGQNIHVASVCPGFTDTEMLRAHVGESQEVIDQLSQLTAFGRLIEPTEIAQTLLFCAAHPVINGSVIHANLGQVER